MTDSKNWDDQDGGWQKQTLLQMEATAVGDCNCCDRLHSSLFCSPLGNATCSIAPNLTLLRAPKRRLSACRMRMYGTDLRVPTIANLLGDYPTLEQISPILEFGESD